jgi:hypothetical protein
MFPGLKRLQLVLVNGYTPRDGDQKGLWGWSVAGQPGLRLLEEEITSKPHIREPSSLL